MTQVEFDSKMNEFNLKQMEECEPIEKLIEEREREKLRISYEINELRRRQDEIKREVFELSAKKKGIAKKYHAMKHQLVLENPKI